MLASPFPTHDLKSASENGTSTHIGVGGGGFAAHPASRMPAINVQGIDRFISPPENNQSSGEAIVSTELLRWLKAWGGAKKPPPLLSMIYRIEIVPGRQSPPITLSAPAPLSIDAKGRAALCLSSGG
jgi:hypothetical protein